MKKVIALALAFGLILSPTQLALAEEGMAESVASALIPGVGQIMNDDHQTGTGKLKIATMWLLELGAIIATPIIASTAGWPILMVGVGIFLVNHIWSSWDAYEGAQEPEAMTKGSTSR